MLEILLIIWLGKKLSALAKERGRSGAWAALGIGFWFFGEIVGFFIGGMLGFEGLGAYPIALVLAAMGAGVGYFIVANLPRGDSQAELS